MNGFGKPIGVIAIMLFLLLTCSYTVNQTEQVIITQFGRR